MTSEIDHNNFHLPLENRDVENVNYRNDYAQSSNTQDIMPFPETILQASRIQKHISECNDLSKSIKASSTSTIQAMISLGCTLIKLKEIVKLKKNYWINWVKNNLSFLEVRSAQNYMKVAKLADAKSYNILGMRVLIKLAAVIKDSKSDTPIKDWMDEKGLKIFTCDGEKLRKLKRDVMEKMKNPTQNVSSSRVSIKEISKKFEEYLEANKDKAQEKLINLINELTQAVKGAKSNM